MPHKTRGAEPDQVSRLLQAPAQIHIVARFAKNGVKAIDIHEGPFVKSHIAARNVFGLSIGEHDMSRTTGGSHHRGRYR